METRPLVLCVDDDPRTLDILAKILARLPVRQAAAQTPQAAIELAGRLLPDLLILDLMMPELDGWQVLEAIRRGPCQPQLRVLILSAKDNPAERMLAANVARVAAFVGKPFDVAELARIVLDLLGVPVPAGWPGLAGAGGPGALPGDDHG
ncbi:MAG: response regulator [Anaerolineales bacterium]|nr:response regulator [Anaerolineales bacterium]